VDSRFYNPNQAGAPVGGTEAPIVWDAFPLVIKRWYESEIGGDRKMYRAAYTPRPMQLRAVRNGALAEQAEVFRRQQDTASGSWNAAMARSRASSSLAKAWSTGAS
jgi:hypothetical protein